MERIFDGMLTSAQGNMHNRSLIRSYDARNKPVSDVAIPTLEDSKQTLFISDDPALEVGYPFRVTTMGDIEMAALLAESPTGTLGHYSMKPIIISARLVINCIHDFCYKP